MAHDTGQYRSRRPRNLPFCCFVWRTLWRVFVVGWLCCGACHHSLAWISTKSCNFPLKFMFYMFLISGSGNVLVCVCVLVSSVKCNNINEQIKTICQSFPVTHFTLWKWRPSIVKMGGKGYFLLSPVYYKSPLPNTDFFLFVILHYIVVHIPYSIVLYFIALYYLMVLYCTQLFHT